MVKKKRAKFAVDAVGRFCVECGINPRQGTTRYSPGSHIVIKGEQYVVCRACRAFGKAALNGPGCRLIKRRDGSNKLGCGGSEYELSEEDIPPSPSWSDTQMELVQSEADQSMNSPGAGS
ncbi:hypothetical protein BJX76DRAFT_320381, partial [Aspergillus varians]